MVKQRHTIVRRMANTPLSGPDASMANEFVAPPQALAQRVFWLLLAINFINYLDRIIFVAVGPEIKHDFQLSDTQVGLISSAFLLIYTVAALPMGLLADRRSRTAIIAFGVGIWSIATWYTAISHTFAEIFIGRAILGIGEASYIPAGMALLSAYFPRDARARVLSRWGASTLLGTALGYIAGGIIAQHLGWRWAFVICGPPGLLLAYLAWRLPNRMAYDASEVTASAPKTQMTLTLKERWDDTRARIRQVLASRTVRYVTVIQAAGLFVVTPSIVFVPIYLREHYHMTVQTTALLAGGVLIPGGILGTSLGGWVADFLSKRHPGGRMIAAALGFMCAAPCYISAFLAQDLGVLLFLAFLATAFMNMYNGPLNAVIQDVVPAHLRASASAIIMTLSHLLGDVGSPSLIGWLADPHAAVQHGHHVHHVIFSISQSLVICGGPVLLLGAALSLLAVNVYVRDQQPRDGDQNAGIVSLAVH